VGKKASSNQEGGGRSPEYLKGGKKHRGRERDVGSGSTAKPEKRKEEGRVLGEPSAGPKKRERWKKGRRGS